LSSKLKLNNLTVVLFSFSTGFLFASTSLVIASTDVQSQQRKQLSPVQQTPETQQTIDPTRYFQEFTRAQKSQMKALEHRHKLEYQQLKTSHKSKIAEWEAKEKESRHRFFAEHKYGPERRDYIRDFLNRRDLLKKELADEKLQRSKDYDKEAQDLRLDQERKMQEFKKSLEAGRLPARELWPPSGM